MSAYEDEVVQEFLVESVEALDGLDASFVALEAHPDDRDELSAVFRTMHTIKGSCGLLGFGNLEALAHKGENLLSMLRDGAIGLDAELIDALLATVDRIRDCLDTIAETKSDSGVETEELMAHLVGLAEKYDPGETTTGHEIKTSARPRLGDLLVEDHEAERLDVEIAAAEQNLGDDRRIGEILDAQGAASPEAIDRAIEKQKNNSVKGDTTIRVEVAVLDDLMNLVGELVLTRNEILQHVSRSEDADLAASSQRLNIITSDLQERVMKTRMQPIASLWSKLPRVVRDLAHHCQKQVRLEMEGEETELDKSLLEAIKDPITHIVRNTVDHGIEQPEERAENGKNPEGVLRLSASHEGGQVNIEISDDGGGMDLNTIRAKAVEKGLVQAQVGESMSNSDAVQLIFLPGFSTAAAVTNLSGRGVGMDVVRTNIEKIGGSVEVRTELGRGTTFKMKIPLTLAIVPALIITVHGRRYAIPQTGLVELLTIGSNEGRRIEFIHSTPVLRIRNRLLPIVDLRQVLEPGTEDRWTGDVVILTADDQTFAVLVDDIIETQEIVVKPLGNVVADVRLFSGATILGDGKVALIVDVMGVAQDAGVLSRLSNKTRHHQELQEVNEESSEGLSTLLLLLVGKQQVAMALEDVARLEEFGGEQVEWTGHRPVIQYRGTIMPLIDLALELGYGSCDTKESISVVVYSHQGRDVGLMIGEVLDIIKVDTSDHSGCVVARGLVTDLINPGQFHTIQSLEPFDKLMGVS